MPKWRQLGKRIMVLALCIAMLIDSNVHVFAEDGSLHLNIKESSTPIAEDELMPTSEKNAYTTEEKSACVICNLQTCICEQTDDVQTVVDESMEEESSQEEANTEDPVEEETVIEQKEKTEEESTEVVLDTEVVDEAASETKEFKYENDTVIATTKELLISDLVDLDGNPIPGAPDEITLELPLNTEVICSQIQSAFVLDSTIEKDGNLISHPKEYVLDHVNWVKTDGTEALLYKITYNAETDKVRVGEGKSSAYYDLEDDASLRFYYKETPTRTIEGHDVALSGGETICLNGVEMTLYLNEEVNLLEEHTTLFDEGTKSYATWNGKKLEKIIEHNGEFYQYKRIIKYKSKSTPYKENDNANTQVVTALKMVGNRIEQTSIDLLTNPPSEVEWQNFTETDKLVFVYCKMDVEELTVKATAVKADYSGDIGDIEIPVIKNKDELATREEDYQTFAEFMDETNPKHIITEDGVTYTFEGAYVSSGATYNENSIVKKIDALRILGDEVQFRFEGASQWHDMKQVYTYHLFLSYKDTRTSRSVTLTAVLADGSNTNLGTVEVVLSREQKADGTYETVSPTVTIEELVAEGKIQESYVINGVEHKFRDAVMIGGNLDSFTSTTYKNGLKTVPTAASSVALVRGLRLNDDRIQYQYDEKHIFDTKSRDIVLVYAEDLHTVETIDSKALGVTMRMFNFKVRQTDFGGPFANNKGRTPNLLTKTVKANGYPSTIAGNIDLEKWFGEDPLNRADADPNLISSQEVNHLFLKEHFDEDGTFHFSGFENYAYLDQDTGNFTVYEELGSTDSSDKTTYKRGNFFPFNQILPGVYSKYVNQYDSTGKLLPATAERYGEKLYMGKENIDYNFGMYIETQFLQAIDGMNRENPVRFEFNGDDDFWVYIDGVLVLDIGGIHNAQDGYIDFSTGQVYVKPLSASGAANWEDTTIKTKFVEALGEDGINENMFEGNTFADGTLHKMQVFYMERGEGASTLHLNFNIAPIQKETIQVTKHLGNPDQGLQTDLDYAFRIYVQPVKEYYEHIDENGNIVLTELYDQTADKSEYEVLKECPDSNVQFDDDGTFHLKAGQTALFPGIQANRKYYVAEINLDNEKWDVSKTKYTENETNIMLPEEDISENATELETDIKMISERNKVTFFNYAKEVAHSTRCHFTDNPMPSIKESVGNFDKIEPSIHIDKKVKETADPYKFDLQLEAYTTSSKETVPLDIVLVLDRSGSMVQAQHYLKTDAPVKGYTYYDHAYDSKTYLDGTTNPDYKINYGYTKYPSPIRWCEDCNAWIKSITQPANEDTDGDGKTDIKAGTVIGYEIVDPTKHQFFETNMQATERSLREFINSIIEHGNATGTNHRISICDYTASAAYSYTTKRIKSSSGLLASANNCKFISVSEKDTIEDWISLYSNAVLLAGNTPTHLGLKMGQDMLNYNDPLPEDTIKRQEMVVVFAAGAPGNGKTLYGYGVSSTDWVTPAISTAENIKNLGAYLYTIGFYSGASIDPLDTDMKSSTKKNGTGDLYYERSNDFFIKLASENSFLPAQSSDALDNAFKTIAENFTTQTLEYIEATVLREEISKYFTLDCNCSSNNHICGLKVEVANCVGRTDDGEFLFDEPQLLTDVTIAAVKNDDDLQTDVINVTGFSYKDESVTEERDGNGTQTFKGKKLVLTVPIETREGFWGGNNIPTNDTSTALYQPKNGVTNYSPFEADISKLNELNKFPLPEVNVPLNLSIETKDQTIYYGGQIDPDDLLKYISAGYQTETTSPSLCRVQINEDGTLTPSQDWMDDYAYLSWNKYANESIQIDESFELSEAARILNKENGNYTYSVSLYPTAEATDNQHGHPGINADGGALAGAAVGPSGITEEDTGYVYILTPIVRFKDSVIKKGYVPNKIYYDTANNVTYETAEQWIEITGTLTPENGSDDDPSTYPAPDLSKEPEISFFYIPDNDQFIEDTKVQVQIFSGNVDGAMQDISHVTRFYWADCTEDEYHKDDQDITSPHGQILQVDATSHEFWLHLSETESVPVVDNIETPSLHTGGTGLTMYYAAAVSLFTIYCGLVLFWIRRKKQE